MRRILAAAALMLAAAPTAVFALGAGVRGAYWFPKVSGTVQTTTGGMADTPIDLKGTLGVEDENLPVGEAFLRAGGWTFRVGYAQLRLDGARELTQTVTFNGQTFTAADNVSSRLDLKMLDGEVQYDFLRPDAGVAGFNLGLLLKVKYVDGKVELHSATAGSAVEEFRAPIPMAGAAVGVGFLKNMLRVDARAAGIAYSGNHLVDAEAYASFSPFPFVSLQGGYRYIDLKIDEDNDKASVRLKGPYVGAQLSF